MDANTANGLAGIASLVTSLLMVPTIFSLRKLATKHDEHLEAHDKRIELLEAPLTVVAVKAKRKLRGRRSVI